MIVSNQQREENFQEYLRLLHDPNYYEVIFDDDSGGVSAIHREHCFDKQIGPFGYRRGQYEVYVANILRRCGHSVLLESEYPKGQRVKTCDALIDGSFSEIKTVESNGRWSIRTKVYSAIKKGAEVLVLYYPNSDLFSEEKILEGWFINTSQTQPVSLKKIICVKEERVVEMLKPPG